MGGEADPAKLRPNQDLVEGRGQRGGEGIAAGLSQALEDGWDFPAVRSSWKHKLTAPCSRRKEDEATSKQGPDRPSDCLPGDTGVLRLPTRVSGGDRSKERPAAVTGPSGTLLVSGVLTRRSRASSLQNITRSRSDVNSVNFVMT